MAEAGEQKHFLLQCPRRKSKSAGQKEPPRFMCSVVRRFTATERCRSGSDRLSEEHPGDQLDASMSTMELPGGQLLTPMLSSGLWHVPPIGSAGHRSHLLRPSLHSSQKGALPGTHPTPPLQRIHHSSSCLPEIALNSMSLCSEHPHPATPPCPHRPAGLCLSSPVPPPKPSEAKCPSHGRLGPPPPPRSPPHNVGQAPNVGLCSQLDRTSTKHSGGFRITSLVLTPQTRPARLLLTPSLPPAISGGKGEALGLGARILALLGTPLTPYLQAGHCPSGPQFLYLLFSSHKLRSKATKAA
ncbi:uncharacterized protein LOC113592489 isoform X2 [Acinonyx jubatus]|uniref:Uncharacterized protein LOC113592489 isoform X2 n=1 Tax=Acinonyx jubatus TaxID=32536 RepID=A0A6J1X7K7_ACIJB|nr:uncharacterized protein LOC113592489 isoform X2 [Acinonyx jubatus]